MIRDILSQPAYASDTSTPTSSSSRGRTVNLDGGDDTRDELQELPLAFAYSYACPTIRDRVSPRVHPEEITHNNEIEVDLDTFRRYVLFRLLLLLSRSRPAGNFTHNPTKPPLPLSIALYRLFRYEA